MADIFISYKHEEQQNAKKLADALQKKGWTVWWDPEVLTGERFHDIIDKELKESKCVVVLWSKLSVESENVKDEATYALKRNKLVPITIEDVDLPYWAERINTGQLINWDGSDNFPGYQKLVSDISKIIAEEDERKRKEAELAAEKERRRRQKGERKLREEEQKRIEAARKAEEERKQKEAEAKRKADEEQRRKEKEELKLKSEEERKRSEVKAEIKTDRPEPDAKETAESVSSEPHKTRKALKFGAVGVVIVLLIVGIWWWFSQQQVNETQQEMESLNTQALNIENAVAKLDKPEQIKELYRQRDTLSNQVEGFSEQATKVGLESQLEELQNRLKQIQIQLANKDKEFIEVRQEMERLNKQALALENELTELYKLDQTKSLYNGIDRLGRDVEYFSKQATKVGLKSELEELQNHVKWMNIQLANKEKRIIAARKGRIFVESVPDYATVKILNFDEPFRQGMELEPGKYHIEVSLRDYESQNRWIELGPGEEKRIKFEVAKRIPKDAEQIPPQKAITNSIGMNFVLIPAGSFNMGSQLSPVEVDNQFGVQADKPG